MKNIGNWIFIGCIVFVTFTGCKNQNDTTKSAEVYYGEQFRNQFHFSPEANWMNDPNGMVYFEGEYHLFYQYYPDSTVWGPMHWAHAVSKDLVHWEHLPIALYPDSLGYIFSGSAVIDKNTTAGFGENAMVAIYTYHDMEGEQSGTSNTYQYQAIAYSTDKGRTFTKYEGNPVIPNPGIKDFRDPKVIWDDNSRQWVMVFAAHDHIKIYGSPNLKDWTHLSDWGLEYGEHGGIWECPDLFPIKVEGTDETKWVMLESLNPSAPNGGSGTQYFVGDFDGKNFNLDPTFADDVSDGKSLWIDYGTDNYAGVTWSNAPVDDDEKLFIGWMSNWQYAQVVPTEKWRSAMTIPRTISLHKENGEYRLRSRPIKALDNLIKESKEIQGQTISNDLVISEEGNNGLIRLDLKFAREDEGQIKVKLSNDQDEFTVVGFDPIEKQYFIDRKKSGEVSFEKGFAKFHKAPVHYDNDYIEMTIFVDFASVELFADEGRVVMTDIVFPSKPYDKVTILSEGSDKKLEHGKISFLNGIW